MVKLNGHEVVPTMFPDKTSQVWKLPDYMFVTLDDEHEVRWIFESEAEIMIVAQVKSLIDTMFPNERKYLFIDYLPYGRQDKEVSNTSTFALRSFANLINAMEFEDVRILDPHSNVATYLINYAAAYYPYDLIKKAIQETNSTTIVFPDKGAVSKYLPILTNSPFEIFQKMKYLSGEKVRDQLSGKIVSYALSGDPSGQICLIVDDLCDGGATFILLTEELLKRGAKEVHLFVSHGIFSRGVGVLFDAGIKRVFTKDGEVVNTK